MSFDREKLGKSFKKVGVSYHLGRRDYPKKLIGDVIKISGVNKDSLILDVGCGTGKSTIPFAKTGSKIVGIDISDSMLRIAKNLSVKHKNIVYKRVSFEEFISLPNSFDLILMGTAIHWLDPKMVYEKSSKLLRKGGSLALFWEPISSLCKKIRLLGMEEMFIKNCPNYPIIPASVNYPNKRSQEVVKSKLFSSTIIKKYKFIQKYSQEEFISLINTYSWVISLSKKDRDKLILEVKEYFVKKDYIIKFPTEIYLIIAKRK